jgi:heat-inducible transcriptional repressor
MADLTLRSRKILHAVVAEYLHTGDAVGSRTVTRRHGIDLSAATVRNVMADLEELGLLEQPHTSAGRVPTEAGLRFFIDSMLKVRSLSPKEKEEIRERFAVNTQDFDEVMQRTSKLLSEITRHAGIVFTPLPERQRFQHIEFVPLKNGQLLCILVTTDGALENKLVQVDFAVDPTRLERIHNYLGQLLGGLTLDEVRRKVLEEVGNEKNHYDGLVSEALRLGQAALLDSQRPADVIVSGQANLLDPAHAQDPQQLVRMRALLQALEDKETLVRLLDRTLEGEGIQVFLGAETALGEVGGGDTSVVAMPYGPEERPLGAIAVIGPMRMNYGKVISVVDFTAELVTRLIRSG